MIKGRGRRGSSCPTPSLADPHILHLGLSLFQGESYVQLGAAYKRRPAPMMPSTLCGSSALVSGLQILLEGDYLLLLLLLLYQHPSKPFSWKPSLLILLVLFLSLQFLRALRYKMLYFQKFSSGSKSHLYVRSTRVVLNKGDNFFLFYWIFSPPLNC